MDAHILAVQHSFLLECGLNLNLVTKDKKYCCKSFNKNSKFKSPSNTASQKWQKAEKFPVKNKHIAHNMKKKFKKSKAETLC